MAKATTKAAPAKKAAAKKTASKKAAPAKKAAKVTVATEEKGPGKIQQIIEMHKAGKTNPEIVEAGFNKTTVSIQVSKFKKDQEDLKAQRKANRS